MPRKTRKQKIASQKRRIILSQEPSLKKIENNIINPGVVKIDLSTELTKKDLLKTVVVTVFLVILEVFIFKI